MYIVLFVSQLYHIAKESRTDHTGDVELVNFPAHLGYGHKNIYKAPVLKEIVG